MSHEGVTRRAPFGSWPSPITADVVTSGIKSFSSLASNGTSLFWLESRPNEGGRSTLLRCDEQGIRELTPAPFNVRSRVHEYGGGAYQVSENKAWAVDFTKQNLHEIDLANGTMRPLTSGDARERFADLVFDAARNRLIAIVERHEAQTVSNCLASIALEDGRVTPLHAGHDFYAAPRLSPDGSRLCFLAWDHPNMPWDGTQLKLAGFDGDGSLTATTLVAGGAEESIMQPEFLGDGGRLVFASDRSGWWNLYSYDDSGLYCIHEDAAEYALPHWMFGMRAFTPIGPRHLACQRIDHGESSLVMLDVESGIRSPLPTQWHELDAITAHRGALCFVGHRPDRLSAVIRNEPGSGEEEILASAGELPFGAEYFSVPGPIAFPTRDGATAYAYFYPPRHPEWDGVAGERPPLLVLSHGGPTGATRRALSFRIQYYTSRGWAVVDVNYRGSTGFGRAYRDALKGRWGIVDVQDCEDAVAWLAEQGRIDPERAAIRGGSAGGFTTLAALTFGDRFKAGASHYGVGDLEALAQETHKFEARYLDTLVGPYPEQRERYRERSPIHHTERLSCPVIFLQGLEDRIVPPNQAQAMVDALDAKGLPVAYLAFPNEQHGFRDAANIKRAMESEYAFFARIFGIDAPDLTELEIRNL